MPARATRHKIAEIGGDRLEAAVAKALQDTRARTRDIGGEASTRAAGDAVIKAL